MTAKTFNPETTGIISMRIPGGEEVAVILVTDVNQTVEQIRYTEVRHVYVGRGHSSARPMGRGRAFHSIKGLTSEFISIAKRPELAELFEDRYDGDRYVSEVD